MVPTESLRPTHGHSLRTRARSRPNHRAVHVSRRAPVSRPVTMASLCGCTAPWGLRFRPPSRGFRRDDAVAGRPKSSAHASSSSALSRPPPGRRHCDGFRQPGGLCGRHVKHSRGVSVVVRAGPNSQQSGDLYVLLGISPTATKAEIKSAYKKAALKWHPDVNKAADATSRFNDVKNAYQTLANADTRRRYDTLRNSGGGGGSTSGWGSNPFGSGGGRSERNPTGSTFSSTSSSRSQKPEDPFYGFSDFWADMEKEFGEFESQRPKNAKPRSLWEELEALGEEFVDFLEEAAPEVSASGFDIFGNKTSSSAKSSTKKDGTSSSRSGTSSGTSTRSSTSGTSTSSSSSSTSSGTSTSGAYSKPWNSSSASAAKQKKTESVDEMLEKLKRDMGMK